MNGRALARSPIPASRPTRRVAAAAVVLLALSVAACNTQGPGAAGAPAAGGPVDVTGIVHVCSSCHGPGGRSVLSNFPYLAGQQKDYIDTQLKATRDHTRADKHVETYMWGMAARLSDSQIAAVAAYYSSQPPVPGTADDSPEADAGRKIYTAGIPAQSVPACMSCHGEHGEGNAVIPRLAGQSREYVERELGEFASTERANEIMHETAKTLTAEQIRDLAAYVRSQ